MTMIKSSFLALQQLSLRKVLLEWRTRTQLQRLFSLPKLRLIYAVCARIAVCNKYISLSINRRALQTLSVTEMREFGV